MEDIQSWWELPSIAHFCSLFRAAFDLLDFDIEELEEALLTDGLEDSGSPLLVELAVRLVQGCLPGKNVNATNYQSYLRKLFKHKCQEDPTRENLFVEGDLRWLPLRRKVEILHALCDFRLEAEDVLDLLKNLESDSLRVEPLGYDDSGSTYWYFYGTRLYREDHSPYHPHRRKPKDKDKEKEDKRKKKRKKKGHKVTESEDEADTPTPVWQVQCFSEEDWNSLAEKFEDCASKLERSLLQTLREDFLPEIPRLFQEKEKIQRKRMMEFTPRRSSCRVQRLKEKKEEEEKKIAIEIVEQEKRRQLEEEKKKKRKEDESVSEEKIERKRSRSDSIKEELTEETESSPKYVMSPRERRRSGSYEFEIKEEKHNKKIEVIEINDDSDHNENLWEEPIRDSEDEKWERRNSVSEPEVKVKDGRGRRKSIDEGWKRKSIDEGGRRKSVDNGVRKKSVEEPVRKSFEELVDEVETEPKVKVKDGRGRKKRIDVEENKNEEASDAQVVKVKDKRGRKPGKKPGRKPGSKNKVRKEVVSNDDDEENDKPQVYSGRKTNNSLSSVAFSLSSSAVVSEPAVNAVNSVTSPPTKKKVKSAHMVLQTEDDLRTGMYKVLEHLRDHEDAWPFHDPVEEEYAPNYYAVIRRPMHISRMEERLDAGYYTNLGMFESDFKLMMDNCKLYNGPESEYTHMAYTLEKVFAKLKAKYLEADLSSDEEMYIDMSYQQAAKRKNKRRSTEEKENKKNEGEKTTPKKRGRKKKKVGRKPKEKHKDATLPPEKEKERKKSKFGREKSKEKEKHRSKDKPKIDQYEFRDDEEEEEEEEEEEDDDDDDFEEPPLLVREDPYPEEDEEMDEDPLDDSQSLVGDPIKEEAIIKNKVGRPRKEDANRKASTNKAVSEDEEEDDDMEQDICMYYNNNDYRSDEEENEKQNGASLSERHNELFGEIDDIEDDHDEGAVVKGNEKGKMNHVGKLGKKKGANGKEKEKKKHKHGDKHEKHHHHHHHKSKSKDGKHHKKKNKHASEKDSKKILKVEDVYDYSEDEEHVQGNRAEEAENVKTGGKTKEETAKKKKKIKHRAKHGKHHDKQEKHEKHKEGKVKEGKKEGKKKNSKKKKIPAKNMAAIDALSAATEQTLKDITTMLEDPSVPRFSEFSSASNSPSHKVTAEEFEAIAYKIEAEYRKKLMMDEPRDKDKKKEKKKKRKNTSTEEGDEPKKKKIKKEKKPDVEKSEKGEKDTLDNTKELFKDIKDGRIKPGAIIKSKDIAKKEGVVKKETKSSTEGKPRAKTNPFGKINKQEHTKLTTLIAKAKESRIGLVPNSEVGDSPKLSLGSIIPSGDIGTGMKSSREANSADEEEKWEPKEKWDSPWENRWEKVPEKEEVPTSVREEEEKEEIPEVEEFPEKIVEEPPPTPRAPEIKQERATPNLSAWFKAFGTPKVNSGGSKKMPDELTDSPKESEDTDIINVDEITEPEVNEPVMDEPPPSPHPPPSPEPPVSPEPPISPEKPPETPWYEKLDEKLEDEPIWKKMKPDEEDDPYKFEEEELDRAREEAKKLEVERQRKASVSSSGVSDRSPLNHSFDSDRSPAAFSSEGERSPMTRSPHTPGFGSKQFSPIPEKSPSVPAYSPRYETSLSKPFPSYDPEKGKYQANGAIKVGFYQDMTDKGAGDKPEKKAKEQKPTESPVYSPTVPYMSSFYSSKAEANKKQKSPAGFTSFYSSSDSAIDKAKTPNYYPASAPATPTDKPSPASMSVETAEKPKPYSYYYDPTKPLTDQYKSTGSVAPSQPAKKPPAYYNTHDGNKKTAPTSSPVGQSSSLPGSLASPGQVAMTPPTPDIPIKAEMQPPKKRAAVDRINQDFQSSPSVVTSHAIGGGNASHWSGPKSLDDSVGTHSAAPPSVGVPFSPHSSSLPAALSASGLPASALPANLANLSNIVSRIPEAEADRTASDKDISKPLVESQHPPSATFPSPDSGIGKSMPPSLYGVSSGPNPVQSQVLDLERSAMDSVTDLSDIHQSNLSGRVQPTDLARHVDVEQRLQERSMQPNYHQQITSPHMQTQPGLSSPQQLSKPPQVSQSQLHSGPQPPIAHQKQPEGTRPSSRDLPPAHASDKSHMYLQPKNMWCSTSLASSLASSLPSSMVSSLVTSLGSSLATTTSVIASLQKMGSLPAERLTPDRLAQERFVHLDRATLASLASRSGQASLFSHELLQRGSVGGGQTQVGNGPSNASSSGGGSSSSVPVSSGRSGSSSSSGVGGSTTPSGNSVEIGIGRSYANMLTGQSSPLFGRGEGALTPGSLPRPLSGSSSPFLPQSPGLSAALGLPGAPRTPTPAHQQSHQSLSGLSQGTFPSLARDPRDPISQSHPSLQIPSLNSISSSQAQTLSHLNAASLASYSGRDSLALMNQGSRSALASGLVDPTSQFYQQYLQQRQAQEDLLLRSAGAHPSQLAHQSMMIQQGLMSAAGYSSGYPPSLGLRPGSYQGMNRPWL